MGSNRAERLKSLSPSRSLGAATAHSSHPRPSAQRLVMMSVLPQLGHWVMRPSLGTSIRRHASSPPGASNPQFRHRDRSCAESSLAMSRHMSDGVIVVGSVYSDP